MHDETGPGGLFASFGEAERADLEAMSTTRRYTPGTVLFHEHDPSDFVLVLREGRVKVSALTVDGREVVLAVCGPDEILGELSAVDGEPRSASAIALEPVVALMIPADRFRDFLDTHATAAMLVLRSIATRLRSADRRDVEYIALDAAGRVAARLVELADRFGTDDGDDGLRIALPITQDELAGWTGCSREAVGKALQVLRKQGMVATGRREITVVDLDRLRSRASL